MVHCAGPSTLDVVSGTAVVELVRSAVVALAAPVVVVVSVAVVHAEATSANATNSVVVVLLTGCHHPILVCEHDGLDPIPQPELGEHVGDVGFDRCLPHVQFLGDLGIGHAACE